MNSSATHSQLGYGLSAPCLLTLSEDSLLRGNVTFELRGFEPNFDRCWNVLDSFAENDLGVFGRLDIVSGGF